MDDQLLLEERDYNQPTTSVRPQSFEMKKDESITKISSDLESSIVSDNNNARHTKKTSINNSNNRSSVIRSARNPGLIIMPQQRAHKLGDRYRYHIFLLYHSTDRYWVQNFIKKVEAVPFEYKCCIDTRDFTNSISEVQNIVCSLILSERVLLILSQKFLEKKWPEIEEILYKMNFNSNQLWGKLLGVWIDKLNTNDINNLLSPSLKCMIQLDFNDENFWQILQMSLRRDPTEIYGSSSTLWSLISQTTPLVNGQILYLMKLSLNYRSTWTCQPDYSIEIETSPQAGVLQETAISELVDEEIFEQILDSLQLKETFTTVCNDTKWPSVIIGLFCVTWFIGLMVMTFKLPDSEIYTLPVRLCVFILPAIILVASIIQRWRALEQNKKIKLNGFLMHGAYLNCCLYKESKPLLITVDRNRKLDTYTIYLLYYSTTQCMETLKHLFKSFKQDEVKYLNDFIQKLSHSNSTNITKELTAHEALCLSLSTSYTYLLLSHRLPLPASLSLRHTRRHLCLCQYIEDFLCFLLPFYRCSITQLSLAPEHTQDILNHYLHPCLLDHLDLNTLLQVSRLPNQHQNLLAATTSV